MEGMKFDLGSVLAQAAKVTQQSQEGGDGSNSMKLIYPQNGDLKVRLLFNQPSGVVMRKFERHTINDKKVVCLTNYGKDCPVCKMLDSIQNVKGVDLWKMKRNTRGIAYAEYIESNYKFDNNDAPQRGEIVLLMFPWTVYTDLNREINSAGPNVYSLIASNVGGVFKISRWVEKGQTKYKANIDPFDHNHQTCASDEEYQKLITGLPSLNEKFVPVEPTDQIIKDAQSVADELNAEYLSPQVYQPNVGQSGTNLGGFNPMGGAPTQNPMNQGYNPMNQQFSQPQVAPPTPAAPQSYTDPSGVTWDLVNGQWIPRNQPMSQPTPAMQNTAPQQNFNQATPNYGMPQNNPQQSAPANNAGKAQCFGQYGNGQINPNQCLMCPDEATCRASVNK